MMAGGSAGKSTPSFFIAKLAKIPQVRSIIFITTVCGDNINALIDGWPSSPDHYDLCPIDLTSRLERPR